MIQWLMLKKELRLRKRKEFNFIYKKGKNAGCKTISVVYIFSKFQMRIGFSVNKKIGNSVVRSKVTRRMREAVKILLPKMKQTFNYIFVARDGIQQDKPEVIAKNLEYVLQKENLLI